MLKLGKLTVSPQEVSCGRTTLSKAPRSWGGREGATSELAVPRTPLGIISSSLLRDASLLTGSITWLFPGKDLLPPPHNQKHCHRTP